MSPGAALATARAALGAGTAVGARAALGARVALAGAEVVRVGAVAPGGAVRRGVDVVIVAVGRLHRAGGRVVGAGLSGPGWTVQAIAVAANAAGRITPVAVAARRAKILFMIGSTP